jgi:hypothetical protein
MVLYSCGRLRRLHSARAVRGRIEGISRAAACLTGRLRPDLPERLPRLLRSSCSVQTGADLTSKADEYRAKARECEERAEQTRDPFIKQQMLDIAQKWHTMAAYEEKYAR